MKSVMLNTLALTWASDLAVSLTKENRHKDRYLDSANLNNQPTKTSQRGAGFAPFCCLFISSLQRSLICGKTPKAYVSLKFMYI